ncbi:hypothetical protein GGU11DRAFT_761090 [Lentinula aff. detonsa]|nr:hypothetical protein GGU11DRAFT_761090 [Lentinula aff. detonsa]
MSVLVFPASMFVKDLLRNLHPFRILLRAVLALTWQQAIRINPTATAHSRRVSLRRNGNNEGREKEEISRSLGLVFPIVDIKIYFDSASEPQPSMEPDETTDEETQSSTSLGWWKRDIYDYCSYYLDEDGIIQKIYHDPNTEETSQARAKTPQQKGVLKRHDSPSVIKGIDRGTMPVSFKTRAQPPKYFLQGRRGPISGGTYGPTKLETNRFRSHDSEGETAWHYSQAPHELNTPLPDTPTPRMLGTIYVHRSTEDGSYQVWVWCKRDGRELGWQPVDLENEQVAHPKVTTRSLKLTSGGKPSWVLNSTLLTYRTRNSKRSRSRPAEGSTRGDSPVAESASTAN